MTHRNGSGRGCNSVGGVALNSTATEVSSSSSSRASSANLTPSASDAESLIAGHSYFAQFNGFKQDYDATLAKNMERLAIQERWSKKEMKRRRLDALDAEFDNYFGTDMNKLEKWQEISKICGIEPIPTSITQCKKMLAKVHINIYNFLDHCRNPERFPLIVFPNLNKLRKYTIPSLIYPLQRAKKDTFVKALLRPIFFGGKKTV